MVIDETDYNNSGVGNGDDDDDDNKSHLETLAMLLFFHL